MSQKVFVTGATGVLGRRVVPALVGAGHAVTAVVRSEAKASAARAAGATPVHVDLFDRDAIRTAIAGHDCVAHLATHIPSGPSAVRKAAWRINDTLRRDAAAAIAGAVVDAGIGRLIQESITFHMSPAVTNGSTRAGSASTTGAIRARSMPKRRLRLSLPLAARGSCCDSRCSWRPIARTCRASSARRGAVWSLCWGPRTATSRSSTSTTLLQR